MFCFFTTICFEKLSPNATFILSAKYGLLNLDSEIEPYDITLNKMSNKQVRLWAENVLGQLQKQFDIKQDNFIFLAGLHYRKHLIPYMTTYQIPMDGLSIGKQLQYLNQRI